MRIFFHSKKFCLNWNNTSLHCRVMQPVTGACHWLKGRLRQLLIIGTLLLISEAQAREVIVHAQSQDPREALALSILKLAIEKSGQGEQYDFEEAKEVLTEGRIFQMVKDNQLSVMWAGTQTHYEQELLPIRIPVLKGLLGHRIFIIRNGEQARFNDIHNFSQLQEIPLGQGRFWGDTAVLKHNKMNAITPVKYESLFHMLEGGRFDYFPRAVHEPWSEVKQRAELNLTVEDNILLIYPFAMYFFVNRDNVSLANTISTGFRNAIDDGSFDELFFSNPMINSALTQAHLKNRTVYRLENPYMSDLTPLDDSSLWLDLDAL